MSAERSERWPKSLAPLLEFDPSLPAVIEPASVIKLRDVPERCVFSFFWEAVERIKDRLNAKALPPLKSEMGLIPLYAGEYKGMPIALAPACVGAPLAAGQLEEIIARGGRKFVACGTAGVLDGAIANGGFIVPTSAVRDEGTSYHYAPASSEVGPSARALQAVLSTLAEHECPHVQGKTWTTDGFYRETSGKVARRRQDGCLTVEMEAAALFAVARFRGVEFAQILCGADDVSGHVWDARDTRERVPVRERLLWLALDACVGL